MIGLLGTNLSKLYFFQIVIILFLILNILPLYYSWVIVAIAIYFFYKESLEKCFYYFICSLPFFIATPFFSFESLSLWRSFSLLLLIKYLLSTQTTKKFFNFFKKISNKKFTFKKLSPELFSLAVFFTLSFFGIFIAQDKIAAIRGILYYLNIVIIGFLSWNIIKNKVVFDKTIKSIFLSGVIILFIAILQEIAVFIVSLNQFWNFWAKGPILVYYGKNLSNLLLQSNTWFSYWPGDFATLRAFSIFQDSHSFGLMMVFLLVISIYLFFNFSKKSKNSKKVVSPLKLKFYFIIILSLLFIILSGTRGLWVSFYLVLAPTLLALSYFLKNKIFLLYKKDIFKLIIIFTACFFVASGLWVAQIYIQNTIKPPAEILLAFKRIKSSFDINEISNKGRIEIWKKSIETAIKNPLFGVGPGNFPVALNEEIFNAKKGASAHNLYLQFLVENGLLGLFNVFILFCRIFYQTYHKLSLKKNNFYAFSFFIAFLWLLAYNLFDIALLNDKIFIIFTILVILLYKSDILTNIKFRNNL